MGTEGRRDQSALSVPSGLLPTPPTAEPSNLEKPSGGIAHSFGPDDPAHCILDPGERNPFVEPYRFSFFQAVRMMHRLMPGKGSLGRENEPTREPVHFRSKVSLAFPPSEIADLTPPSETGPLPETGLTAPLAALTNVLPGKEEEPSPEMLVEFLGLAGVVGAMPLQYTEMVLDRLKVKDPTIREFLDVFNHRLVALFYRAWEKYRFYVPYERGRDDFFTGWLMDLVGMGTPGLRGRMDLDDQGLAYYAGLLSMYSRSVAALEPLLSDYFSTPMKLIQFVPQRLPLEPESLSRVGVANSVLGESLTAGTEITDHTGRFRLRVGPMGFQRYQEFLPVGSAFRPLSQIARLFAGEELAFDFQPVLRKEEVPPCVLGSPKLGTGSRLGWTSWLKSQPFERDADDCILEPPR